MYLIVWNYFVNADSFWFVSSLKMNLKSENACLHRMWQLGLEKREIELIESKIRLAKLDVASSQFISILTTSAILGFNEREREREKRRERGRKIEK